MIKTLAGQGAMDQVVNSHRERLEHLYAQAAQEQSRNRTSRKDPCSCLTGGAAAIFESLSSLFCLPTHA